MAWPSRPCSTTPKAKAEIIRTVRGQESLRLDVLSWQESVLEPGRQMELSRQLGEYKTFLEGLCVFNNPGRLRREACSRLSGHGTERVRLSLEFPEGVQ